jgi:hypothetical protein
MKIIFDLSDNNKFKNFNQSFISPEHILYIYIYLTSYSNVYENSFFAYHLNFGSYFQFENYR